MRISRRVSWFLLGFGVWSWIIWATFGVNLSRSENSWGADGSPTPYFIVHAILAVVSFVLGTLIGALGVRGLRGGRSQASERGQPSDSGAPARESH